MNKRFLAYFLAEVFVVTLIGCNPMDVIVAEWSEVSESCEVVFEQALYKELGVDPGMEAVLEYTMYQEPQKRSYLSGCGAELLVPDGKKMFLKGTEMDSSPVSRQLYFRFPVSGALDIPYHMKCIVGGLSNAGTFMDGWDSRFSIQRQGSNFTCSIFREPGSAPKLSAKQSGD